MGLFRDRDEEYDDVAQYKKQRKSSQENKVTSFDRTDYDYNTSSEFDLTKPRKKAESAEPIPKNERKFPEHRFPKKASETKDDKSDISKIIWFVLIVIGIIVKLTGGVGIGDSSYDDPTIEYTMPTATKIDVKTFVEDYENALKNEVTEENINNYDSKKFSKGIMVKNSYYISNTDDESLRCIGEDEQSRYCVYENFSKDDEATTLRDIDKYFSKEELKSFEEEYEAEENMVIFINNQSYSKDFCEMVKLAYSTK